MSAIVVCLDCPEYIKGGFCRIKNKTVGALQPVCDQIDPRKKRRDEARSKLEKECAKCHRVLPVENFSLNAKMVDGRQSFCRECQAEAYKNWASKQKRIKENQKNMEKLAPQAKTKTCTKCGRELPISEFYAKAGSKDGLQTICKECHNIKTKESIERRKAKLAGAPEQTKAPAPATVVVREKMTAKQMVDALRADGWIVTCKRTITEEL